MVDETTATATNATTPLADIVVGVDGSDESFAALKWAMREASLTGQSINAVFGWTHSWDTNSDEPDRTNPGRTYAMRSRTNCAPGSSRPATASILTRNA